MRRTPFVALLVGVVLLSAGLLGMAGAVAQERPGQDASARRAQVASAFTSYFERARSLDLLFAQTRLPAGDRRGHRQRGRQPGAALYLEHLYPGAIGEAMPDHRSGPELAR